MKNNKNLSGEERDQVEEIEANTQAPTTSLVERTLFRGGVLSAFGVRDFRLLWSGALVSNIGTWIHMAVLMWLVKEMTGKNLWVGVVNSANLLPVLLFVLYAGSLADRLNRKKLILVTQVIMMFAALALAICTTLGLASLGVIITITLIMGTAFAFNFPSWRAIVPDIMEGQNLLNGIALDAAQWNAARFIGPALGALILTAWGPASAFYINAASFLTVIVAILFIKTKTPGLPPPTGGTRKHIMEGLRYVRGQRWATNLLIVLGIASLFGLPFMVLLPSVSREILHRGPGGFGLLLGLTGLGAVTGAPFVTIISRYLEEKEIIKVSALAIGLLLIAFSSSKTYWLSLLLSFGLGTFYLMMAASINTVLQSRVHRELRGRIMSLYILVFQGMFPIGGLVMGFIADIKSTSFSLMIGGAVIMLLGIVLLLFPSILIDAVSIPSAATV